MSNQSDQQTETEALATSKTIEEYKQQEMAKEIEGKILPEGSIPIRYKAGGLDELYNLAYFTNVDRDNDFFNYPYEIPPHILSKVKEIVITLAGNVRAPSWFIYANSKDPEMTQAQQPIYKQVLPMANYNLKVMIGDSHLE